MDSRIVLLQCQKYYKSKLKLFGMQWSMGCQSKCEVTERM